MCVTGLPPELQTVNMKRKPYPFKVYTSVFMISNKQHFMKRVGPTEFLIQGEQDGYRGRTRV